MQLSSSTHTRFERLKEKYQASDEELMKLLIESFEVMNGNQLEGESAIATTGQKRESAYLPLL